MKSYAYEKNYCHISEFLYANICRLATFLRVLKALRSRTLPYNCNITYSVIIWLQNIDEERRLFIWKHFVSTFEKAAMSFHPEAIFSATFTKRCLMASRAAVKLCVTVLALFRGYRKAYFWQNNFYDHVNPFSVWIWLIQLQFKRQYICFLRGETDRSF